MLFPFEEEWSEGLKPVTTHSYTIHLDTFNETLVLRGSDSYFQLYYS